MRGYSLLTPPARLTEPEAKARHRDLATRLHAGERRVQKKEKEKEARIAELAAAAGTEPPLPGK